AVFAGGWTLEDAEQVCSDDGRRTTDDGRAGFPAAVCRPPSAVLRQDEVLDLLTSLVDKSLVLYEEGEVEARYRLLETVRHYAGERLRENGQADEVRRRHRDHFLALAEAAEPQLTGSDQ